MRRLVLVLLIGLAIEVSLGTLAAWDSAHRPLSPSRINPTPATKMPPAPALSTPNPATPELAIQILLQALAANDQYRMAKATSPAVHFQIGDFDSLAVTLGIDPSSLPYGQRRTSVYLDQLQYSVLRQDAATAEVRITGHVLSHPDGYPNYEFKSTPVDYTLPVVYEGGQWLVNGVGTDNR